MVAPVVLRVESFEDEQKGLSRNHAESCRMGRSRSGLPTLQDMSDVFILEYKGVVHRQLLKWVNDSLGKFAWLSAQTTKPLDYWVYQTFAVHAQRP